MFNTINESKYQKYKNKYLTQKKIVGSGKVSFPKISVPKVSVPKVSVPKVSVPKVSVPKVSVPKNLKDLKVSVSKNLKDLKVSVSKNLKDLKVSVPKDLKVSVPGLNTIGNTSKLTILAADSKVRGIVQDVSNDNLIKTLGDPKIVGLIKKLINDNELIGSLKKHKLLNTEIVDVSGNKLFDKLKETINSLE
jgi:hypothetical protein